jgi:hypothetical protein
MSDVGKRLTASLRMDAINGDAQEREIVARQAKEAVGEINRLTAQSAEQAKIIKHLERVLAGLRG